MSEAFLERWLEDVIATPGMTGFRPGACDILTLPNAGIAAM